MGSHGDMRPLFPSFTLAAILAGSQGIGGTCGPDNADDIPYLEDLKADFLNADYAEFAKRAGPYFPDLAENARDYFGQVMVVFPSPFPACATILQRREDPGFYQDLVFYFPAGSSAPVALLLIAARAEDKVHLIEFTFDTSISDVLEDIK